LKIDPNNETLKGHLNNLEQGENPFFNAEAMSKLMANERT